MNIEALKNGSLDRPVVSPNSRELSFHATGSALLAVMVTLLFWAILPPSLQQNDSTDYSFYYEPVARNFLKGNGMVRSDGALAINNPPGYSLLLASIFTVARITGIAEEIVHSLFVLICIGLSSAFVFLLSEQIWGRRGGWLSALFFMTYPFMLWLTKQPSTEVPFMAAFYAGLYLFWLGLKGHSNRSLFLFSAGICMGLAMMIRGIALGMGIVLCILLFLLKQNTTLKMRFVLALTLLAGNAVVILPWQAWMYGQTGQMILLGTNGIPSITDGLTFAVESKNYRQEFKIPADVVDLQKAIVNEADTMNSLAGILRTLSRHFVEEPSSVLKLFLIKAVRSWYGTDSGRMESMILVVQLFYAVLLLLATAAVWRLRYEIPGLLLFVWAPVFYFWLMTILVLSILRYMTPTMGLFSLMIPALVYLLPHRMRRLSLS